MGVKDVCSRCACCVEEGWSYCMHCGAARTVKRSSLSLSMSLYSNSGVALTKGKKSLRGRRQSSEDVRHQLQQWRRKSKTQETLLQELERCNATAQRAVAAKTESDLRRIVHDGRALVRNWPSSSTLTTSVVLPTPRKTRRCKELQRSPSASAPSTKINNIDADTRPRYYSWEDKVPTGNVVNDHGNSPCDAHAVYAAVTSEQDKLYSHRPSSAESGVLVMNNLVQEHREPILDSVPREDGVLPQKVEETAKENSSASSPDKKPTSGWFWGGGGSNPGVVVGAVGVVAPGEGTMAAFWREVPSGFRETQGYGTGPAPSTVASAANGAAPYHVSSSYYQASSGEDAATGNPSCDRDHPLAGTNSSNKTSNNSGSGSSIGVASAKAATRSARNRTAELARLLSEGNNPPREECLAKAESAVRAAGSAISCANERLFQLELTVAGQENQGVGDGMDATPADETRHGAQWSGSATGSSCSSSSLMAHIEQLTEQLKLAQSLQAASLTTRARLIKRFALEDAAAARVQALARGSVVRWKEKDKVRKRDPPKKDDQTLGEVKLIRAEQREGAPTAGEHEKDEDSSSDTSASAPLSSPSAPGANRGGGGRDELEEGGVRVNTIPMPRKEELWWTLAEAEGADEIGESEAVLLRAVVKLQALVRSRLARSETIAAVNARFVEYFDDEHQHPFYVCGETSTSQWNRPFGFGLRAGAEGPRDSSLHPAHENEVEPVATEISTENRQASTAHLPTAEQSADRAEEPEPGLLRAAVKLQALVRSRVARSKTFASVNARFVEHFDEVHQLPFYFCTETSSSQWNQPFGYGLRRAEVRRRSASSGIAGDGTPNSFEGMDALSSAGIVGLCDVFEGDSTSVAHNGRDGAANDGEQIERTVKDTLHDEAAATVIQCAVRSARARGQLAERIVLAGL